MSEPQTIYAAPKSFVWSSLGWLFLGAVFILIFREPTVRVKSLMGFGFLWILCNFDLYLILKVISSSFLLMSVAEGNEKAPRAFQLFFWGVVKISALGLTGYSLYEMQSSFTGTPVVLGVGTLVFVPLVGGFFWSQRELVQSESKERVQRYA